MKEFRTIEASYKGSQFHMVGNGFKVTRYFPKYKNSLTRFSPFVLLDYNPPHYFEPSSFRRGSIPHPHKGIETVTLAYLGGIEHHDNKGNHGIIGPGDVQWMTAGSGVLHKEYHEESFSRNGGLLHMLQLWIDLPKKNKMTNPKYQTISKENMTTINLPNNFGEIKLISGEFKGIKGPATTFSPINLYNVYFKNFGKITLNEPNDFNTGILVISGKLHINGEYFEENDFILFNNVPGDINVLSITETSLFLVLSGKPLNQSVFANNAFVMNTKEDLTQACEDFKNGKFGVFNF